MSELQPFLPSGQGTVFAWFEVLADVYCCVNVNSGMLRDGCWCRKSLPGLGLRA